MRFTSRVMARVKCSTSSSTKALPTMITLLHGALLLQPRPPRWSLLSRSSSSSTPHPYGSSDSVTGSVSVSGSGGSMHSEQVSPIAKSSFGLQVALWHSIAFALTPTQLPT